VRIGLLGPLEVRDDAGVPVPLAGGRLRALLSRLALDPGRTVPTRLLIDAVWGDEPPEAAANALQALISRLRRAVPGLAVQSEPGGYRLDIDPQWTDVARFERLTAAGRAQAGSDPDQAAGDLRAALALWRGPALADAGLATAPESGFAAASARLTELRLAALEQLAELAPGEVIADLTAAAQEHPTRERLAGALMRALWTDGRPADALAVFERTREALADTLGVDPAPELRELHVQILRSDETGPAPATPRGSTLRTALTSFVGRDDEVARVRALVTESRLTTLVGPGGAGKTRLAVESARGLRFRDGTWLCELAPITDPVEVASAVLSTLGLREQALLRGSRSRVATLEPSDPTARVIGALADKQALLVFDNCEHVIDAAAKLVDLVLADCPQVRVLATSREPLTIAGETLWTVQPLTVPMSTVDSSGALTYSAVRLLSDRGSAARPGFTVDESNVDSVVELCRALDGMPLAIELAAARLRTMAPAQIAERLDDRFRLLVAGSRTALPRHQTLRAVVDWSWELLSDEERTLLRRLAVFTGGASVAAAETVCATGPATLTLLTSLVDKSLIEVGTGDRYGMLETIKAYGLDRLADAGEATTVRAAHGAYFLELAQRAEPELRRRQQLRWLAQLAAEHENLHSATRRAAAAGDAALALELTANLGWYWFLHGHRAEGGELARLALSVPGPAPAHVRALSCIYGALNSFMVNQGDGNDISRQLIEEAVALTADAEVDHPLLRLLRPMRQYFTGPGQIAGTQTELMAAFSESLDDPDPWVRATAHLFHAHSIFNIGHDEEAEAEFQLGVAGFRAVGDRWGTAFALATLAEAAAGHGDHQGAADYLAQSLETVTELGTNDDLCQVQAQYAHELLLIGQTTAAHAMLAEAARTAARSVLLEGQVQVSFEQGEFARFDGDYAAARRAYERALEIMKGWPVAPQFKAVILAALASAVVRAGDLEQARALNVSALSTVVSSGDLPAVRRTLVLLADYVLHTGDAPRAAALLGASADQRGRPSEGMVGAAAVVRTVQAALTSDEYAEAFARGRATGLDDLAALAGFTTPIG
jgi:predicted ATPase/DNA-binding SARP family transcriptional activator